MEDGSRWTGRHAVVPWCGGNGGRGNLVVVTTVIPLAPPCAVWRCRVVWVGVEGGRGK